MSITIDTEQPTEADAAEADGQRRRRIPRPRKPVAAVPVVGQATPRKRRSRRKWVAAGLAVVLLVGGGSAWELTRGGSSAAAPAPRTITQTIAAGDVSRSVQASGTLAAANVADLSFPSSGTVNSVKVAVGDKVTKGQALASIDKTSLQLAVNSAQATYDQSTAQLNSAEANLAADQAALAATKAAGTSTTTTAADLATQEQNEQAQIDSAQAQIAADESSLAGAQNNLNSAKANLVGATLTSPITGVVSAVNVSVGATVSGGGGSGSGSRGAVSASATTSSSAAVEVADMTQWVVSATVSGADLGSIKVAQEAQITTSGSTQSVFGTVATVGVVASSTSGGSAVFPVTIDVTGSPSGLHPGDTASITITTQQLTGVLTVPTAALSQNGAGQTVVTKLVNGVPQPVVVTLGDSYGTQTIVTAGLSAGDQIQFTFAGAGGGTGTSRSSRSGTGTFGGGGFSGTAARSDLGAAPSDFGGGAQ